jgi:serine/threonine-protein kinase
VRQVGSALAAAHREGIVHRDLKPQNIFLVPSESDGRAVDVAKVLDFGISKIRGSDTVKTQDSTLLGTPQYMAPEQATGQHDRVDERTDLFALGAIVYEMVAGHPAFSGANIPEVVFKVVYEQPAPLPAGTPPRLVTAVERAMAKKQDDRFPDVNAFVEALTGSPLPVTRPPSLPPTGGRTPSRNTGKEAFDQTVGSGDHGPTAVPPPAKTGDRPREVVITDAPTLGPESAPPAPDSASAAHAPAKSRAPLIALVGGGLAIAAGLVLFVLARGPREDAPPKPAAPTAVAEEKPEPVAGEPPTPAAGEPPTPAAPPVQHVADRPVPPEPPRPPEPRKPAARVPAKAPAAEAEPADDSTPASPDDETSKKLADAEAALAARDFARAERLANAVINGEHAKPGQLARAHVVHAIVECAAHNDRGLALADLRAITVARQRKKLSDSCAAAGMTLDE